MVFRTALLAILVVGAMPRTPARGATPAPSAAAHIVVVKMVDEGGGKWAFEPSTVQAQPGDTVRFLQTDIVPHNVQFKSVPKGAKLGPTVMMGRFLLKKGETYDLVMDSRFVPGTYHFVCTPHEMMGMKGTLDVGGAAGSGGTPTPRPVHTPSGGIR